MGMWQHERDFIDNAVQHEPNAKRKNGTTALMTATKWNEFRNAEILINNGADVNAVDDYGYTALIMAAIHGRSEIALLLLAHGADPNLRAPRRGIALEAARHLVETLPLYAGEYHMTHAESERQLREQQGRLSIIRLLESNHERAECIELLQRSHPPSRPRLWGRLTSWTNDFRNGK